MGDITGSGKLDARDAQDALRSLVDGVNTAHAPQILSPLTITLGDEFQGVCRSFESVIEIIFAFERARIDKMSPFRLHYAAVIGPIDTAINPEIAHGMLGAGLTEARRRLTARRRGRAWVELDRAASAEMSILGHVMAVADSILARWKRRDYPLIAHLLREGSDAAVGKEVGKTRSQIYKRRRTLMVDDIIALETAAKGLARLIDGERASR